jgi:hypothetical protein
MRALPRAVLLAAATALACGWLAPVHAQAPPDLSASARIFESSTAHNSFPDECDMRLQQLYIAEGLELSIEVQFSRALTDEESRLVQWSVSNGDSGDFSGQPNPALITTTVTADSLGDDNEAQVRVTYQGVDLTPPLPMRIISDAEYNSAYRLLAGFTARDRGLPLTSDLLARFLGQQSSSAGRPDIGTYPLSICDPRLTQRAGADWGSDAVTNVPLVHYDSDQPAASAVGEGVARALLAQHAQDIRQFFATNPTLQTHRVEYSYNGELTLDFPLDVNFALHGVQFDGALSATVDAPTGADAPLTATDIHVNGTVADLYDFNIEDTGAGARPAIEAAKIEIASVKHDIGKVFVVSVSLDTSIDELHFDPNAS